MSRLPQEDRLELEGTFDYLTLAEATKLIPGRTPAKRISLDSIWRWCIHGVGGIRLQSVLIGGRRFTSRKWLNDFIQARSQGDRFERGTVAVPRTSAEQKRAAERASQQLREAWRRHRTREE